MLDEAANNPHAIISERPLRDADAVEWLNDQGCLKPTHDIQLGKKITSQKATSLRYITQLYSHQSSRRWLLGKHSWLYKESSEHCPEFVVRYNNHGSPIYPASLPYLCLTYYQWKKNSTGIPLQAQQSVCLYVCMCLCVHIYTWGACMCVCLSACMCTCMYTYVCMCYWRLTQGLTH